MRIFDLSSLPEKESEFSALKAMASLGVRCSLPIELGRADDLGKGYMLLSFLEGADAADALPTLSHADQYKVGLDAGQELKKIHQHLAPSTVSPWGDRKRAKFLRHLSNYQEGDTRIPHESRIIDLIETHSVLMSGRPNVFQHDDFHPRNLVIQGSRFSGVIDFGRHDWGDPVHEFLKIGHFSAAISAPFSIGQVIGYHDGAQPPEAFWKLYALYSAMSLFSIVIWTQNTCPDEMPEMLKIIDRVIDDQDCFTRTLPKWFSAF